MLLISATSAHTQADAGCCCQPSHKDNADPTPLLTLGNSRLGGYNSFKKKILSFMFFTSPALARAGSGVVEVCSRMLNMAHTFTVKCINNFINVIQKSFRVTIPWHQACSGSVSAASVVNILTIILARPQRQQILYLHDQTRITKYVTQVKHSAQF